MCNGNKSEFAHDEFPEFTNVKVLNTCELTQWAVNYTWQN